MSQYLSQLAAIILGTFVSEDMTCISVGLLIRKSQLHPLVGLSGCLAGIILGDFGIWLAGRIAGRRLLQWKWVQRRLPGGSVVNLQRWIDERCTAAVLAARLLPGTRAIMYLAIGALGNRPAAFLLWSLVAAVLWTPALVLGTALFGDALGSRLTSILGSSQWAAIVIGGSLLALLHAAPACSSQQRRAQFLARLSLLWRWEFWPSWLFYLPLIPWLAVLALRYRSLTVWTAANPGIPQGGVVGESKFDILSRLPQRWTVASFLIDAADPDQRAEQLRRGMQQMGWNFPLILKPDASQRGASVRRIDSLAKAETYFAATAGPAIAQSFHPGPYEAGIFYFRRPGEAHGRIFSITDKHFPAVTGDGSATLEQLIWRHPRLRMQADVFLRRLASERQHILPAGETRTLALAGNHCQGTMFCDGDHLITPELEQRIDAIAQHFPGFYIGRFDVRYTCVKAFCAGEDLAIVELNGVTSESTNLYDPAHSLRAAYSILFRQWALLFEIGNANRLRGIQPASACELLTLVRSFYRQRRIDPLAD